MVIESTFDKRCTNIEPPTQLSSITASFSFLFLLVNIPSNILIILAVVVNPCKKLRTPFNWLVVNLAIADLMVGFVTEPTSVYYHIKESLGTERAIEELISFHMVYFISCTASILSLTSLAVERYLAVRKLNTYRTTVTNKRIILTVTMIWLISLALSSVYLVVHFTIYAFLFANVFIAVAVLVISVTYNLMRRKFRKVRSKNSQRNSSKKRFEDPKQSEPNVSRQVTKAEMASATNQTTTIIELEETAPSTSAQRKNTNNEPESQPANSNVNSVAISRHLSETKVTKMFLTVLIAVLCCYGPSTIMMYLVNFCEDCSCTTLHCFRDVHILFVLLNSSVNFFCYAFRCNRFRSAFAKLLRINRK